MKEEMLLGWGFYFTYIPIQLFEFSAELKHGLQGSGVLFFWGLLGVLLWFWCFFTDLKEK